MQGLYFVAIIPNVKLREEVKSLKEIMRDQFSAKHALKSPAHITLIPPFKRDTDLHEVFIIDFLKRFAVRQNPISLSLNGFKCFQPRVIFIDFENKDLLRELYFDLKEALLHEMLFNQDELSSRFHPHMTIATRDLTKETFQMAWRAFKTREFREQFEANSIFLLKHNGKFWDIFREFQFENQVVI